MIFCLLRGVEIILPTLDCYQIFIPNWFTIHLTNLVVVGTILTYFLFILIVGERGHEPLVVTDHLNTIITQKIIPLRQILISKRLYFALSLRSCLIGSYLLLWERFLIILTSPLFNTQYYSVLTNMTEFSLDGITH